MLPPLPHPSLLHPISISSHPSNGLFLYCIKPLIQFFSIIQIDNESCTAFDTVLNMLVYRSKDVHSNEYKSHYLDNRDIRSLISYCLSLGS